MEPTNSAAGRELVRHVSVDDRLHRELVEFERRVDLMLEAKLQRFRAEFLSGFGTMLFISQAVVITAIGVLLIAFD